MLIDRHFTLSLCANAHPILRMTLKDMIGVMDGGDVLGGLCFLWLSDSWRFAIFVGSYAKYTLVV